MSRLLVCLRQSLKNFEASLFQLIGGSHSPYAACPVGVEDGSKRAIDSRPTTTLESLLQDSMLWAVPKSRRSVEKRLCRKFGWPHQVWKPIVAKKNLVMCNTCGDHHEAGHLCLTCYERIKSETAEMNKATEANFGLSPIDKEVVVIYQGERPDLPENTVNGKRIIEMKKERPAWFSRNLVEQTTQPLSPSTSVKPSDLA